jgi:hypothetical protein
MPRFSGTIAKLAPGDRAFYRSEIGGFRVQHDKLIGLPLGVHEASIQVESFTNVNDEIVAVLVDAPAIGDGLGAAPLC